MILDGGAEPLGLVLRRRQQSAITPSAQQTSYEARAVTVVHVEVLSTRSPADGARSSLGGEELLVLRFGDAVRLLEPHVPARQDRALLAAERADTSSLRHVELDVPVRAALGARPAKRRTHATSPPSSASWRSRFTPVSRR